MRRHEDWLRQARKDLLHAEHALDDKDYAWSCFAAQQAAEKALKAPLQARGVTAWGHAASFLAEGLAAEDAPPEPLLDALRELDGHYIMSRHPDAHPQGAPLDFYTKSVADRAVGTAKRAIEQCIRCWARVTAWRPCPCGRAVPFSFVTDSRCRACRSRSPRNRSRWRRRVGGPQ